jgi:hypothetical protein
LGWVALQEEKLERFQREMYIEAVRLPHLTADHFGMAEIDVLAAVIGEDAGARR